MRASTIVSDANETRGPPCCSFRPLYSIDVCLPFSSPSLCFFVSPLIASERTKATTDSLCPPAKLRLGVG